MVVLFGALVLASTSWRQRWFMRSGKTSVKSQSRYLAVAVSAIATGTAAAQPEGTRGSAGNLAGSHKDLDRPGGYPAGQQCWGGFYGWSIKHNV